MDWIFQYSWHQITDSNDLENTKQDELNLKNHT